MISVDESFSCKFVCYFLCRVRDYIATGIATRLVDPDGDRQHVGAKTDQQLSLTSWELPTDGWTKNLDSLPQFSYDHLFVHLVSNSKTVAAIS